MPLPSLTLIDASLFAHIENDPELTGTVGLEGNNFIDPIKYLLHYFSTLSEDKKNKISGSAILMDLVKEMADLEEAIENIKAHSQEKPQYINSRQELEEYINSSQELEKLKEKIAESILKLPINKSLLMPGGWLNVQGEGHAMV